MKIYPHILLKKGDIIQLGGGREWHVIDMIDGHLMLSDSVHIFSPPWGFFLKKENYFVPLF